MFTFKGIAQRPHIFKVPLAPDCAPFLYRKTAVNITVCLAQIREKLLFVSKRLSCNPASFLAYGTARNWSIVALLRATATSCAAQICPRRSKISKGFCVRTLRSTKEGLDRRYCVMHKKWTDWKGSSIDNVQFLFHGGSSPLEVGSTKSQWLIPDPTNWSTPKPQKS